MRLPPLRDLLHRRIVIVLLFVPVLLIAVRAVLPIFVADFVNRKLADIPDFHAHIEDVDLHLIRGAYSVRGLDIVHIDGRKEIPFLSVPTVDLSIEWRALLHGAVVGQIDFYEPRINIVVGAEKKEAKSADRLTERFSQLLPLRINHFAVYDAELHFREPTAQPPVDIYLDRVQLVARNLTNRERVSESLAATVSGEGRVMRSGTFTMEMKLDPTEKRPTYQLAFELKDLRLPELNNFLRHYLAVEAHDGWFSMSVESTASKGQFRGYVKPVTRDLDILQIKKEKNTVTEAIKGFFVKIIADIFKNKPKDQLATKIDFSGTFENPEVSVWEAASSFLRNAFVRALEPGLEGTVAPAQVEREQQRSRGRTGEGTNHNPERKP